MSEEFKVKTEKQDDNLSFWYEYKPNINVDDGTLDLEIDHTYLKDPDLADFDFDNPPIDPVDLSQSMVKTMRKLEGYGLSANQVGLPVKVFCLDGEPAHAIFNPSITYYGDEKITLEEGCLSYPGFGLKITRPRFVRARFQDPYGDWVTKQFDGITARVFQHEFDHTEGVDFISRVSRLKKNMAIKKWKKKYGRTTLSLPL